MATVLSDTDTATLDARPIIPRNRTNLWTKAEDVRDALYRQFANAAERAGVEPLVLASGPSVFPAWVKFEAWVPVGDGTRTQRSSVLVTIEPKPYHTFDFEFEVSYSTRNRDRTLTRVAPFTDAEAEQLIKHVLHGHRKPSLRRFREMPLQLWREKNEIEGLRGDYLAMGLAASAVAAFMIFSVWPLGVLPAAALAVFCFTRMRQRAWLVLNEGKPRTEPRSLVRVDSWQTVVFGLAAEEQRFKDRFRHTLQNGLGKQCSYRAERVWYWGLDGKEEREQLVLFGGRGIVFCQIYTYGGDLYVGWDGHLNRGQWVEQTLISGIDKETGNPISMSRVVPGVQPTTEYDLTDLSCLMEWTHAQIVKLLKELISEKQIDQEIDFHIQRAERRDVVASGSAATDGDGLTGKVRAAFRRTA